jgi:tRNA modification GTPase
MNSDDTIAAIATPPGVGGIGVIRISGPKAREIAETLTRSKLDIGRVQLRDFLDADGSAIDQGLALCFAAPRSFTGEDVVELQGHGGPVLQEMLLARLVGLGCRLARPGEFSERAFLNGKLDLAQAEAIADLIESGSQAAARAAMKSLQGAFSERIHALVEAVIDLRAFVEAALDFAEEEIDFLAESDIRQRLEGLLADTRAVLAEAERGRLLNEGLTVAIAGRPNAGKSSLLNRLAGYDAAIVTDIAGTTRDVIRAHIALKGIPLHIIDTAGLRDSDDPVEREGIRRAWREIEQADRVLMLIDATSGETEPDRAIRKRLEGLPVTRVYTKADLLDPAAPPPEDGLLISSHSGQGMDALIDSVVGGIADRDAESSAFLARQRHVEALQRALAALQQAEQVYRETESGELMAEDLRQAQQSLSEITGEFTTEDLLGRIFGSFCIGK